MIKLEEGDCRKIMRRMLMVDRQFHSIVTDPPYHLLSIAKRFGKASLDQGGSVMDKVRDRSNPHARHAHGFVGQSWDGADPDGYQIAHDPRLWRMAFDLLLPGGYCLAFTSPMTGHRMAVAMEDAGFRIHGFIGWAYGSGMPKAHAVGEKWPGWFHSTQTLKPALEPVYIAQRPPELRPMAANMARHGVGGMNVDGCRVGKPGNFDAMGVNLTAGGDSGRWPATLAHDGSPAVLAGFPAAKNGDGTADYFNSFPPFLYHGKAAKADRAGSDHPTVKPITLIQWLLRLVTPPGGTVLDPFLGSGTLLEAAYREGFNAVGIEQHPEYVKTCRQRIARLLRSGRDLI